MLKTKKHSLFLPKVLLTALLSLYVGTKIYEAREPEKSELSSDLETWVTEHQGSSFSLNDKNYYSMDCALYDLNDDDIADGILVSFIKKRKHRDSPWTGVVGYFELSGKGQGKASENATIVYPFKNWDIGQYGKGLKDTRGDDKLNKIMTLDETGDLLERLKKNNLKKEKKSKISPGSLT